MTISEAARESGKQALLTSVPTQIYHAGRVQSPLPGQNGIEVALLTGGFDRPYAFGLSTALASKGVRVEVIGSDEVDSPEMHNTPELTFLNVLPSWRPQSSFMKKVLKVGALYARLIKYAAIARPKLFHVLWHNKVPVFDRTLLLLGYKALGKRIVLTAHNVNAGIRDGTDSPINRLTLRIQYHLVDHIFVHTQKMHDELVTEFRVKSGAVTVIPFGVNNAVPHSSLTTEEAKRRIGINTEERTILFFGNIRPYKGVEYLVEALAVLTAKKNCKYRLIIAGQLNKDATQYWAQIQEAIVRADLAASVLETVRYIPDSETELYFKAADVSILPYTHVYQSGVLLLGYSFGLPAIASDVGSLKEDIVEGRTGFVCKPCDATDLARVIEMYFNSGLFQQLDRRRQEIIEYANDRHSWDTVGEITRKVYCELLGRERT